MAYQMKPDRHAIEEALEAFRKAVEACVTGQAVSCTVKPGTVQRRTTLEFTEQAWIKMQTLIHGFSTEVGWVGTAERFNGHYRILDVLVPPQMVSAAHFETDDEPYELWTRELDDDTWNRLRFHGHSHVEMGTTPSGEDEDFQRRTVADLRDDDFYIFVIWNKKNQHTIRIYDKAENVFFGPTDIDVEIDHEEGGLMNFLESAKAVSKPMVYASKKDTAAYTPEYPTGITNGYNTSGFRELPDIYPRDAWWRGRRQTKNAWEDNGKDEDDEEEGFSDYDYEDALIGGYRA